MNVYDFDGTIYNGDSTADFYRHCMKECPNARLAIRSALWGWFLYLFGVISKTAFKQRFFSFLRYIPGVDDVVSTFWIENERKIKPWYLTQKRPGDIVISASPEFLLAPMCRKLGVTLIASKVDKRTGKFDGPNCHGEEKVRRLAEVTDVSAATAFYSDSLSDQPLADMIPDSFMVRGNRLIPWSEYRPSAILKAKNTFLTPEFFLFVFCGGCGTVVNFCFSLLFSQRIDPTLAYVCGYAVSLFATYALNSALIFKKRLNALRFTKFVISYIPNFLILFTFVAVLLNVFHLWKVVVYAGAALFGLPITFILVKLFAFRGESPERKASDE
jgi:HAD superfamily phosphoserine phosphatase-like hydrolase